MLVIHLQDPQTVDPVKDGLGRTQVGWTPSMSLTELYEAGRGCWKLNFNRARREDVALFVAKGEVRAAMTIKNIHPVGDRYVLDGEMLKSGNEIYDAYVGKMSPVTPTRNPIRYWSPPGKTCACGCGTSTDKEFVAGHDQRAIHERISRRFRSVSEFLRWFDSEFPA